MVLFFFPEVTSVMLWQLHKMSGKLSKETLLMTGARIYGMVGFFDADSVPPYSDKGQLQGQVSLQQGGNVTVMK